MQNPLRILDPYWSNTEPPRLPKLPSSSGSFSLLVYPKDSKVQLALGNSVGANLANHRKVQTGKRQLMPVAIP